LPLHIAHWRKPFGSALLSLIVATGSAAQLPDLTSTSKDRQSVNVTVYNSNLALVRETRRFTLPTGRVSLRFADVAAQIRPETVHLTSLTGNDRLSILEQNYQYDLLNPAKLLDKYVGRELTLVMPRFEVNKEAVTPVKATLLSNNSGQVWKINNQIVINPYVSETRFPDVPANLVATPTLVWILENSNPVEQVVEASYLTSGLNWRADYVLVLNSDDARADLQGWVTLTNGSGLGFDNARLQLVAGNINRVNQPDERDFRPSGTLANPATLGFREESLFEYHLYTLQHPTSIREQETKQVSLLEAADFIITKDFVINGQHIYYHGYNIPEQVISEPVGVYVEFRNSQQNKLGLPLPAGTIRLYKRDDTGAQQFIGENLIKHTPKDEDVRVKVGDAFDIVAQRKQTDYKEIHPRLWEYAYEIKIRNHKSEPITVIVNEPIGGDWEVLSSSYRSEKTAAFAARFRVQVEKDGEATLVYRVRINGRVP
jgi:hypothetical protein